MGRMEAKIYSHKWTIPSSSDPSKSYTVSLTDDGQYECSCPQWIYRRRECKHIQQVKDNLVGSIISSAKKKPKTGQLTIGDLIDQEKNVGGLRARVRATGRPVKVYVLMQKGAKPRFLDGLPQNPRTRSYSEEELEFQ